jgi:HEAT repeat protein
MLQGLCRSTLSLCSLSIATLSCGAAALAQSTAPPGVTADDLRVHYANVERELRDAAPPLDAQRAAARAHAIDLLHEYRTRGVFGIGPVDDGRRGVSFVDDGGRRCAVAFLLDHTGEGGLTQLIAGSSNRAWVADLAANAALQTWLDANGLNLVEAARIQGPHGQRPVRALPPAPSRPDSRFPDSAAPGDVRPPSGHAAASRQTGAAATPATGRSAPAAVANGAASARGYALEDLNADAWQSWWTWNRSAFLNPGAPSTATPSPTQAGRGRAETIAALERLLHAESAELRGAAVLALGCMGAPTAALTDGLDDSDRSVRLSALLALGADRKPAACHRLLACSQRPADRESAAVALAMSALDTSVAIGNTAAAVALPYLRTDHGGDLAFAAAAVSDATRSPALRAAAVRVLSGDGEVMALAAAAEALGDGAGLDEIAALTAAASAASVDVRRSAALALGRSHHALALPALLTAHETEHEAATRAALLLAIGDHGGAAGKAFLLQQMAGGPKPLRAFAALALGLWAQHSKLGADIDLVRQAAASEHNHDLAGAWLLALGMLRDAGSRDAMLAALRHGEDSETRAAAADALAMLGDANAVEPLAAALAADSCPFVRSAVATALGSFGAAAVPALLRAMRGDHNPSAGAEAAYALGAIDDLRVGAALLALAEDDAAAPAVRAGAVRGLGRFFRTAAPSTPQLRFQHNHALYPAVLAWALQQDL